MVQFETMQSLAREAGEAFTTSFGAWAKGAQAVASETADFAKRSLEQGGATVERLSGVRTLDKAVEVQGEYLRSAYETLVSQTSRMGDLATDTMRETVAPFEGLVAKTRTA